MELGPSFSIVEGGDVPLRTWWDDTQQCFLALTRLTQKSLTFQMLTVPESDGSKSLIPSESFEVALAHPPASGEEDTAPRIPINARVSLDLEWVVLQYSDTLLYVLPCKDTVLRKKWAVDLSSGDGHPVSSPNSSHASGGGGFRLGGKLSDAASTVASGGPFRLKKRTASTILSILWSDHEGNSQDLVVVTTESVMLYKVSLKRKSMNPTHTFSVASSNVWWEPTSRCLVVGSLHDGKCSLRTYFLYQEKQQARSSFPRLELPPPEKLPVFSTNCDAMDSMFLVHVLGEPHFVEVEESGKVTVHRLDRKECTNRVVYSEQYDKMDSSIYALAVDNVICFNCNEQKVTILLDLEERESHIVKAKEESTEIDTCYSSSLWFLAPSFLHSTAGNGSIAAIQFDFEQIARVSRGTTCLLPFFLRRKEKASEARQACLLEMSRALDDSREDRAVWLDAFAAAYMAAEGLVAHDFESSERLITACALLPNDLEFKPTVLDGETADRVDLSALTQSELVESRLLPFAKEAISTGNNKELQCALNTCLEVVSTLESELIEIVPCLLCLLFALLWRLGHASEALAILRLRARNWSQTNDQERDLDILVETVLTILASIELGIGANESHIATQTVGDSVLLDLVSMATPLTAARLLLEGGKLVEAMEVCKHIQDRNAAAYFSLSEEMFRGTIQEATKKQTVAERCQLLVHLHRFLVTMDPKSVELNESGEVPSRVASAIPSFCGDLLDELPSKDLLELKAMFGYRV